MRIRSILTAAALTATVVLGGAGMATADDTSPSALDGNMQFSLDGAGQSAANGPSGFGNGPAASTMVDQD
ncbi:MULTISPECIES: hypothetical protein [unclassified Streptomyces]|uniref:hypothetical protein n=1 Tax=unclassified Streptomyces TaxID=2593676 RepID=UPI0006B05176|nr:hypothetical protein [Streptomyces sp. WM6378]KOU39591.1 hypothetical protein ADK54_25105 [Streptomyces sp. WM6378]